MPSVLQEWVMELPLMMQALLITAVRGPDGIIKEHPAKEILRYFRRSILIAAWDNQAHLDPYEHIPGSFMGPLRKTADEVVDAYINAVDEIPHHFQLHLMHAAECIGYKHPDLETRSWWLRFYITLVKDAHLNPETEAQFDKRLSGKPDDHVPRKKEGPRPPPPPPPPPIEILKEGEATPRRR